MSYCSTHSIDSYSDRSTNVTKHLKQLDRLSKCFDRLQIKKTCHQREIYTWNIPENIRLIPQTSHSPELNPVEHLWEAIRENYFYNEVFDSLEKVIDTLCEGLNFFNSVPEQLKSMTFFPHLRITF